MSKSNKPTRPTRPHQGQSDQGIVRIGGYQPKATEQSPQKPPTNPPNQGTAGKK